jgi:hypothetical protein
LLVIVFVNSPVVAGTFVTVVSFLLTNVVTVTVFLVV